MLDIKKAVNKSQVIVGDILAYSIMLMNVSNVLLEDIVVEDLLESQLEFINGSIYVDGVAKPTDNILAGIKISSIQIGETKNITFKVKVIGENVNSIMNKASASFTYIDSSDGIRKGGTEESNIINTIVAVAQLQVIKKADKILAQLNENITYTVIIKNTGTVTAQTVMFKDILQDNVQLVKDSFKINGRVINSVDLEKGIIIGNISIGQTVTITYSVRVLTGAPGYTRNCASAEFIYNLPNGSTNKKESNKAEVQVNLANNVFKQISLNRKLWLMCHEPDIYEAYKVVADVGIESYKVIKTIKKQSNEGQKLTGYKLIVEGYLDISVEYIAKTPRCSKALISEKCPFTTFLILDESYKIGSKIEIEKELEYIGISGFKCDYVEVGAVLLIRAKVQE